MQTTHENLQRHEEIKGSSNRSFGLVFAAFFLIVALWPLWSGAAARSWAIAIAIALGILAFVGPMLLEWPNRLWLRLGLLLNRVVSPAALALVFYAAVTPMGLLMRLLGKDLLRLRRDAAADSYWIARTPPGPAPDSLKNQF